MLRTAIAKKLSLIGAAAFMATALTPVPSLAKSEGRRNTAIGLGAASLYELFRGHTTTGVVLGAGAAYAYHGYQNSKRPKHYRSTHYGRGYSRSHNYYRSR